MQSLIYYPGTDQLHYVNDDATRTVTEYGTDGSTLGTHPYDDFLNSQADARKREANAETVRDAVENGIARLDALIGTPTDQLPTQSLWAVRNADNATINANPAPYIKGLATICTFLARGLIQVCRIAVKAYADISDIEGAE